MVDGKEVMEKKKTGNISRGQTSSTSPTNSSKTLRWLQQPVFFRLGSKKVGFSTFTPK
jgi:hypothetical protein